MFREIIHELFYEKTRIILTILALAWGTFSIALMLAIGEGLRINFERTMASAGNKLLMINSGATSKNYRGMHANEPINFSKYDLYAIAKLPNVASVTPQYSFNSQLRYKDKNISASIQAVTPGYAKIHKISVGAGQKFITQDDLEHRNMVIVIGSMAADTLFAKEDNPAGRTVFIGNYPFRVAGVMEKKAQMMSTETPDSSFNWIPSTTYELLANPLSVNSIAVGYKEYKDLPATQSQIQQLVALNHGADPNDSNVVSFSDLAKTQDDINSFFYGMKVFLGIIGGLTLLIAGVGIANVMYVSVLRSTREIGVRMAIGATTGRILAHYILQSLVATAIGGIVGVVMTAGVVGLIRLIPLHGDVIDAIGKPEPVLSFSVLAIVVIVLGVIGFLAGLFPALKASQIDPTEALNYE